MKRDRRRFDLSPDAESLLDERPDLWERIELADGPAAQSYIGGGGWSPPPRLSPEPDLEEPEEDHPNLFEDL